MSEDYSLLPFAIHEPLVCAKCADEVLDGRAGECSMQEHARLDVGFTARGFQVWCRRHDVNVVHFDFDGATPRRDFRCFEPKAEDPS
ncbi:MAG: hypothetical protein V2I63_04320 [Pseudomonadales bacterium]|jgi:hypothetical protein|nr:hypothetical protein [Pseudomonadales bacterium]